MGLPSWAPHLPLPGTVDFVPGHPRHLPPPPTPHLREAGFGGPSKPQLLASL